MKKNIHEEAITLIALVVSIIILLILAGVALMLLLGENGLITKAQEANFIAEMTAVKEKIHMKAMEKLSENSTVRTSFTKISNTDITDWDEDLKKEIIYWGRYDIGISQITKEYAKNNWQNILNNNNVLDNLYLVDDECSNGKPNTYLYDVREDIVFKIPTTKIWKFKIHSLEELFDNRGENDAELIDDESQLVTVDDITYYEPNIAGFDLNKTSIVYYEISDSIQKSITVPVKEYLNNGKQRIIEKDGVQYEFYNYNTQKWANIVVESSNMKSYWTWIPRYCYKQGAVDYVKFISLEDEPEEGYIIHSDFLDGKKGIWASKYEPVLTANTEISVFPYYVPDTKGFNIENTYIEVYNEDEEKFEETKLSQIESITEFCKNNNWFNYEKQIWANIKVYEPESKTESWWVWIPRYAYNITGNNTSIIFIDTQNKPLDGSELPSNYIVHSAFENDKKGIWVSKYEPVLKISEVGATNQVNPPDMRGYNVDNTFIECYDEVTNSFKEQTLRSILSSESVINSQNIVETVHIDYSKINGTWYSYDKQIWANIKVREPQTNTESWWVWIPNYAYNITGAETSIIYLNAEGQPLDGSQLPSNYIPHSAFTDGKKGIWVSKYEPVN